jgi:hypothetical protein
MYTALKMMMKRKQMMMVEWGAYTVWSKLHAMEDTVGSLVKGMCHKPSTNIELSEEYSNQN